jgi:hypothetical protein
MKVLDDRMIRIIQEIKVIQNEAIFTNTKTRFLYFDSKRQFLNGLSNFVCRNQNSVYLS